MIKKLHFILLIMLVSIVGYSQQCGTLMEPVSLQDRIEESTLVVEGQVKTSQSFWDVNRSNIYTVYEIEIYKVAKGFSGTTIQVAILGGSVGEASQITSSSASLKKGDTGIFLLKNSKVSLPVKNTIFDMVAAAQGFVRYDKATEKASDIFYSYSSVEKDLYSRIQTATRTVMQEIQPRPVRIQAKALLATPSISGFSPNDVAAGTGEIITITGTNFGATQGTVSFADSNAGGASYTDALDSQVISWTDTEIQVEVPSGAGTGNVRVTNTDPATDTSSQTLTVRYNHLNASDGTTAYPTALRDNNSSGGYTFQYHTDFDTSSAKSFFEEAFELWNCETAINFVFGATTTTDVSNDDGINIVRFDNGSELASGVLGQVTTRFAGTCGSTGRAVVDELDITWNDTTNWYYGSGTPAVGQYDFKSVALHELGHAHQLGHVIDSNLIMHYNIGTGVSKYSLDADDIEGANYTMSIFTQSAGCGQGAMTENSQCCSALAITTDPSNHDDCEGETATFSIAGTEIATYQWQVNTGSSWSNISDGSTYSGTDTATLTVTNPTFSFDGYQYRCVVENTCGDQLTSNDANMTIDELPSATVAVTDASCSGNDGQITFTFPDNSARTNIEFSLDGGNSYPYNYSDNTGSGTVSGLAAVSYDIWVRWGDDSCPVDLGSVTIGQEANPTASVAVTDTNCGADDGVLTFTFSDVATRTTIQFSINNGTSYDYSFNDNAGSGTAAGLAAGDYDVWVSYDNGDCPVSLGQFTVGSSITSSASVTGSTNETVCDADDGTITLALVDDPGQTTVEVSINGGTSYDYTFNDNAGSGTINSLAPGDYEVWSRWGDDSCAAVITTITIAEGSGITAGVTAIDASTGQSDGILVLTFPDNASQTQVKFSIDNGSTYPYTFDDSLGTAEISNLAANTYNVWVSNGDDTCPTDLGSVTISEIDYTSIPDTNFETALDDLGYDNYLGDNRVPTSLINTVTSLNLNNRSITDFTGLADFVALEVFICRGNGFTTLDISNNINLNRLSAGSNPITNLDISNNVNLSNLALELTDLASLDTSNNTALSTLNVGNTNLSELDLSQNSSLINLRANDITNLTSLNVKNGNNTNVLTFIAENNPNLLCIQVDDTTYSTNNWTRIDAQTSFGEYCRYTSIPDSNFEAALEALGYDDITADGQVPTELIETLTSLDVRNQSISDLTGIEDFIALESLLLQGNNLTSINISTLSALEVLWMHVGNNISSLDTSNNTALRDVRLDGNSISTIDLSANTNLGTFYCTSCDFENIDLSNNLSLTRLRLDNNMLTSIDLSSHPLLTQVRLNNNQLTSLDIKNGANTNISDFRANDNANLFCIQVDDATYSENNWTTIDAQTNFTEDCSVVPVITLNGANPQVIERGNSYTELGATADDGSSVVIDDSDVNTNVAGSYTVTYNATNIFGNDAVEVTRTVNIVDTTAPVITLTGANPQTIELGDGYTELGATTDDGTMVTIDDSEFVDAIGTYTIYYDATDASGNDAVQVTRTVNVVDTTDPTVICQNITAQLDASGNVSITAVQVDNGSNDLSGIASMSIDVTDFDCSDIGDVTVTLTVTDNNSNTATCMATITIEDSIGPVFDMNTVPEDQDVGFDTGDQYTLEDFTVGVVATDNCEIIRRNALATSISQDPVPGTLLGAGDHVITLTATDDQGNETDTSFTITVSGVLSVDDNAIEALEIYPNPTADKVYVTMDVENIQVYNMTGQKVIETVNNELSLASLESGVYFLQITTTKGSAVKRIVKK